MWDKRKPKERVKTFVHHEEAVSRVEWCPHNSLVFSSAAADHKVDIWDISKIGREQTAEEKLDGPPELLFIHAGHKSKVTDSSWHPSNELLIASVEEGQGNAINFWKMVGLVANLGQILV
jgi:histone-binding protein RBBP4